MSYSTRINSKKTPKAYRDPAPYAKPNPANVYTLSPNKIHPIYADAVNIDGTIPEISRDIEIEM